MSEIIPSTEEQEKKPSWWPDYWRGTIVFSLLLAALVPFVADSKDTLKAFACSLAVFFPVYPFLGIAFRLLVGNPIMFILATIVLSGGPLMIIMLGGFIMIFSKLLNVRKLINVYIPVIIVAAIVGILLNPGEKKTENKKNAPPIAKQTTRKPPSRKTVAAEKKALFNALNNASAEPAEENITNKNITPPTITAEQRRAMAQQHALAQQEKAAALSKPKPQPEPRPKTETQPEIKRKPAAPPPPRDRRTEQDWQNARQSLQIGGVMQGSGGRMALINNNFYRQGDTVSVTRYGKTFSFKVKSIDDYDVDLERAP
ncbi:MAG: hypothetical protein JRJ48_05385 [Deltaproteobacteria bacterium]|nr:hypothetical protein [Deltaproteobacteria bacterium]